MQTGETVGMKSLESIRLKLGYSRYKMAQSLGISQTSYDYLEQKAQGLRFRTLIQIKKLSGLTWKQFGELLEKEDF